MAADEGATAELMGAVDRFVLPIWLVDLEDLTVLAVSRSAVTRMGVSAASIVDHPLRDLMHPDDWPNTYLALDALRRGAVDCYRAFGPRGMTGSAVSRRIFVRAVECDGRRMALVEASDDRLAASGPLSEYLGSMPLEMAVGTINREWVVLSVSSEIRSLLGVEPADFIGRRLLGGIHQGDVDRLLEAGLQSAEENSAGLRIRIRDSAGEWKVMACVLTSLSGTSERLFLLMPDLKFEAENSRARIDELERHLWRIAAEVDASGILRHVGSPAGAAHIPERADLTLRQWEVLSRLARGDRVSAIARDLSISPSAVRNHVSAILRRFGVSSQAELMAVLRERDEPSG